MDEGMGYIWCYVRVMVLGDMGMWVQGWKRSFLMEG